jgi:hypothetical protein
MVDLVAEERRPNRLYSCGRFLAVARLQGLGKGGVEPPAAEFRGTLKNGLEVSCRRTAQLNS